MAHFSLHGIVNMVISLQNQENECFCTWLIVLPILRGIAGETSFDIVISQEGEINHGGNKSAH